LTGELRSLFANKHFRPDPPPHFSLQSAQVNFQQLPIFFLFLLLPGGVGHALGLTVENVCDKFCSFCAVNVLRSERHIRPIMSKATLLMPANPMPSWFGFLQIEAYLAMTLISIARHHLVPERSARSPGGRVRHWQNFNVA
jgi:hypothetical protein